jgi:hypothetical protein
MGDADILRFVHDSEVEHHILVLRDCDCQGTEQMGLRN